MQSRLGIPLFAPILLLSCYAVSARAEDVAAFYRATWAGLPAAEMRLSLGGTGNDYRDEIHIETEGLARWITKFHGGAVGEGHIAKDGTAAPTSYVARYDLRKRHDSRISMRFVDRDGGVIAERNAEDTSRKAVLAERFRRNVMDPIAALASIREVLRVTPAKPGGEFTLPVYDGARRFDALGTILNVGGEDNLIHVRLMLHPIAGFKGESSEDGDPDSAPREVEITFTNDDRLVPMFLRVSIAYLPLVARFDHYCASFATCSGKVP